MSLVKTFRIVIDGEEHLVEVEEMGGSAAGAPVVSPAPRAAAPAPAPVAAPRPAPKPAAPKAAPAAAGGEMVNAPLQGKIQSVNVASGDQVKAGDTLVVIEAMKMENEVLAPHDGVIAGISVSKGDIVSAGDPLVSFK